MAMDDAEYENKRKHVEWLQSHPEKGKHPSMKRRKEDHDYTSVCIYMITIAVADRRPLLGELRAPDDEHDLPWLCPSTLGKRVMEQWNLLPTIFPQVKVQWLQLMPDHVHGIVHVTAFLTRPLGHVVSYFKARCTREWREMSMYGETQSRSATISLWESGFNDRILTHKGQLNTWVTYLRENPLRLWVKRTCPQWFTVGHVNIGGARVAVMGNVDLLNYPLRVQVQCSRHMPPEGIAAEGDRVLELAASGAVAVSPCISVGEKTVMRRVYDAGFPQIVIVENGFSSMEKPQGRRFVACLQGRLLLVAPWEHHNEHCSITREQCMALNALAKEICK